MARARGLDEIDELAQRRALLCFACAPSGSGSCRRRSSSPRGTRCRRRCRRTGRPRGRRRCRPARARAGGRSRARAPAAAGGGSADAWCAIRPGASPGGAAARSARAADRRPPESAAAPARPATVSICAVTSLARASRVAPATSERWSSERRRAEHSAIELADPAVRDGLGVDGLGLAVDDALEPPRGVAVQRAVAAQRRPAPPRRCRARRRRSRARSPAPPRAGGCRGRAGARRAA